MVGWVDGLGGCGGVWWWAKRTDVRGIYVCISQYKYIKNTIERLSYPHTHTRYQINRLPDIETQLLNTA